MHLYVIDRFKFATTYSRMEGRIKLRLDLGNLLGGTNFESASNPAFAGFGHHIFAQHLHQG